MEDQKFITNQEVIDQVYKWFVTEDHSQALNSDGCQYKIDDNTKCAVGCLIPDSLYSSRLEGMGIQSLLQGFMDEDIPSSIYLPVRQYFSECDVKLLEYIQTVHDGWVDMSFKQCMTNGIYRACIMFDLKFPGDTSEVSPEIRNLI